MRRKRSLEEGFGGAVGINGGHTPTFPYHHLPPFPLFSCFPLFLYTMSLSIPSIQRVPLPNLRGLPETGTHSRSLSPPTTVVHQLGVSAPPTVDHLLGSSRISFPTSKPSGRSVAFGPDRKPDHGPLPQGATIHLEKVSSHDLLEVLSSPSSRSIGMSSNEKSQDSLEVCPPMTDDFSSSSDDDSTARGDLVFVRQDLLFGPSDTPVSETNSAAAIRRHQAFLVSKALDACTLPAPVDDHFDDEAHREFMEDIRQRQSDPKNPGYMTSADQARRNATFMAARAAGNEAALDPEARPASRDLPFELESHEEHMASLTTSGESATSFPRAPASPFEGNEDFSSPVPTVSRSFRVSELSGFAAFVGDDEDPVSERVRKRAAFFHTIFGTDTDDSDEEFVPRAILSDELSSSSDDGSSDSDDNATGMSSMQIISALPSQDESASGSDLPSPSSVVGSCEWPSQDPSLSHPLESDPPSIQNETVDSSFLSPTCSPVARKRSKIERASTLSRRELSSGNMRPWVQSQELMEGPPEGTGGWVFESEKLSRASFSAPSLRRTRHKLSSIFTSLAPSVSEQLSTQAGWDPSPRISGPPGMISTSAGSTGLGGILC